MIVKVIFSFSYYSSLYIVFAILVYRGLNTILAVNKCIKIIISGVVVTIIITFIYQLGSSSNNNLNFILTI